MNILRISFGLGMLLLMGWMQVWSVMQIPSYVRLSKRTTLGYWGYARVLAGVVFAAAMEAFLIIEVLLGRHRQTPEWVGYLAVASVAVIAVSVLVSGKSALRKSG